jgi:nuclear transport factor 2 (NTF2) superfamily protein
MTTAIRPALTLDEAHGYLATFERLFSAADVEGILACFPDRFVIRFADFPEMNTKDQLEAWLRARFARQRDYRIKKTLMALSGNVIGSMWTAEWIDTKTGKTMEGRGAEFCEMRDGLLAVWHAAFNVWEKGGGPTLAIV